MTTPTTARHAIAAFGVSCTLVRIYRDRDLVACHARSREPFARVIDPAHYAGLWRRATTPPIEAGTTPSPLIALGRSLEAYAAAVEADATW